eukprot:SAG31_NODE_34845_length_328_cov_1.362445_1_plen_52_part_10
MLVKDFRDDATTISSVQWWRLPLALLSRYARLRKACGVHNYARGLWLRQNGR